MAEWRDRLHVAAPKVVDYLLAEEHPDGASKATFFLGLGFQAGEPGSFAAALMQHGRSARLVRSYETSYGTRYVVEGTIADPGERFPVIRSIWTEPFPGGEVRLVTAYPIRQPR